jgi:hypothetical protein
MTAPQSGSISAVESPAIHPFRGTTYVNLLFPPVHRPRWNTSRGVVSCEVLQKRTKGEVIVLEEQRHDPNGSAKVPPSQRSVATNHLQPFALSPGMTSVLAHHLRGSFVRSVKIIPIKADTVTPCMCPGVASHLHEHDEAAWRWTSSFAMFLHGHTNQLHQERLGEATHRRMF